MTTLASPTRWHRTLGYLALALSFAATCCFIALALLVFLLRDSRDRPSLEFHAKLMLAGLALAASGATAGALSLALSGRGGDKSARRASWASLSLACPWLGLFAGLLLWRLFVGPPASAPRRSQEPPEWLWDFRR